MSEASFDSTFRAVFALRYTELFRWLDRYSGDPSLAADVAQETFVRLHARGNMPEDVRAWLVSVALNLVRDEQRRTARRRRLLMRRPANVTMADAVPGPEEEVLAAEQRDLVRRTLDRMTPRDRALLLLREEGYSYRELGIALALHETSVGTLLARAKSTFREAFAASDNDVAARRNNAGS